mgnify:CR=1 FL=1
MIPVNSFNLDGNEKKYINQCIDTKWISSEGPFVKEFEKKFSSYIGMRYGTAVSNGSAALDIAIKALKISKGDEVIMPTFTIISPAQSIINSGAIPVLIDSCIDTWNMDVDKIEKKITEKTKAILVVHIYGIPTDLDPIIRLCKKYNLKLIEDAAEVHGLKYKNKMCGSFGHISTFSFYPNKHITTGEGGMIISNNKELDKRCKKLRNLCFETKRRRFIHYEIGWNYRMTNLQAALGLAQLEKIKSNIEKKHEIGRLYQRGLSNIEIFKKPIEKTNYANNIYWVFGLIAKNKKIYSKILDYLKTNKIGTRPFFWCMHEQPVFNKMGLFLNESYPIAEKISRLGFYIPSGIGLKKSEINYVIQKIKEFGSNEL